jgi:hypothetical protein
MPPDPGALQTDPGSPRSAKNSTLASRNHRKFAGAAGIKGVGQPPDMHSGGRMHQSVRSRRVRGSRSPAPTCDNALGQCRLAEYL